MATMATLKAQAAAANSSTPIVFPKGRKRYLMAVLSLCVTTICYADRTSDPVLLSLLLSACSETH